MYEMLPVFLMVFLALAQAVAVWVIASVFGPKHNNPVKEAPFECGNPSYGTQGRRFSIKYFMVALIFLVFDLEVVYIYPWAVLFRRLGFAGFLEMLLFMSVLIAGLAYVWRKGALEWD